MLGEGRRLVMENLWKTGRRAGTFIEICNIEGVHGVKETSTGDTNEDGFEQVGEKLKMASQFNKH
jgi:hypothetical protein